MAHKTATSPSPPPPWPPCLRMAATRHLFTSFTTNNLRPAAFISLITISLLLCFSIASANAGQQPSFRNYHHQQHTSSHLLPPSLSSFSDGVSGGYNTYHVDQGHAEEVVAVPHDAYVGYEVLRLSFTSSPTEDVSLSGDLLLQSSRGTSSTPAIEPRFRLLAESDSDANLVSIFASDSEDLERHAYEIVDMEAFGGGGEDQQQQSSAAAISTSAPPTPRSSSTFPRWHFALLSDGLLMTTRNLADLVNKPVFLAVREDASPYYVRDRVFRINVYNNTRLSKVRFSQPSASGRLRENAPAGSLVEGLEALRLIDGQAVIGGEKVVFALIDNDALAYGSGGDEQEEWTGAFHSGADALDNQPQSAVVAEQFERRRSLLNGHHHHRQDSNNDDDADSKPFRLVNDSSPVVLSNRPLDREQKPFYDFILSARSLDNSGDGNNNTSAAFFAQIPLRIHLEDENDNPPVFERALYEFYIAHDTPLYSLIGNVSAADADDSDAVIYHLTERHPNFVIVPKTGQLMLIKRAAHVPHRFEFEVYATDDRIGGGGSSHHHQQQRRSSQPVPVIVEVYREETYDDDAAANEDNTGAANSATLNNDSNSSSGGNSASSTSEEQSSSSATSTEDGNTSSSSSFDLDFLQKSEATSSNVGRARAKREIRHTKTYEFKESDGTTPGMVVFQLDKQSPAETFRLEHPSKWVIVDPSGAVKVKEPWDYEQLGKDKTIDFWVECLPNGGE